METGKQHLSQHAGADVDANHAARGYCLGSQSCHQACTAVSNMASMALLIAVQGQRKLAPILLQLTSAGGNVQYILPSLEVCPLYKLLCYGKVPLVGLFFIFTGAAPSIKHLQHTLREAHRIKDPQWLLLGAHAG